MKKYFTISFCITILVMTVTATCIGNDSSGYMGSDSCKDCHTDAYDSWKASRHASIFTASDTSPECMECHVTGINDFTPPEEYSVGCEACHGPGKEHIAGDGNPDKIVSSNSADICGRCHSNKQSGENSKWIKRYRPGMRLSEVEGLDLISVDSEKLPPAINNMHPAMTYNMWFASGHSKKPDRNIKVGAMDWEDPVSCVACHNPHHSNNLYQLRMKRDKLCISCHLQDEVLKGRGAKGIEETRNLHTPTPCFACHMTEGNHLMKVLRPDSPDLAESRFDSCTVCHKVGSRQERADQMNDWEAWYRESMEPLQEDLKAIEIVLKGNPDLLNDELKVKMEDIKSNLSIIIKDGSKGVHNLDYALEIMALAKRHLKQINKAIQ
ncbi:cytochrome c3 family protein [Thermodesulfobacteriota bacterium]